MSEGMSNADAGGAAALGIESEAFYVCYIAVLTSEQWMPNNTLREDDEVEIC